MNYQRYNALIDFLNHLPTEITSKLEILKSTGIEQRNRDDFIWFALLQSFSTMGNSRGCKGLIQTKSNYENVDYQFVIDNIIKSNRVEHFDNVLRKAKVRMPSKKAKWLASNLIKIENAGGVLEMKKLAFSQQGRKNKIKFMKMFDGIGDKYGRNMWMDVYDIDFHNSIAIDNRIKKISKFIGIAFSNSKYEEHEEFYLKLARDVQLQGWELDRIMYEFNDTILTEIDNAL